MYIDYFVVPPILVERPLFVVSAFDNKLRYLLAEVWGLRPHILPSDYAVRAHYIHLYRCCHADDYVEDMLRLPISVISLVPLHWRLKTVREPPLGADHSLFSIFKGVKLSTFVNNDNSNCNNLDLKMCAIIAHFRSLNIFIQTDVETESRNTLKCVFSKICLIYKYNFYIL